MKLYKTKKAIHINICYPQLWNTTMKKAQTAEAPDSSRKSLELLDELRHSNQLLNEAQEIACIGSWSVNLIDHTVNKTDEYYRIIEHNKADYKAANLSFLDFVHPDDIKRAYSVEEQAKKDHQPFSYEVRLLVPSGALKYVSIVGKVIINKKGEAIELHGTIQDITEKNETVRKLRAKEHEILFADEAVHQSLAFSNGVISALSSHIAVIDKTGTVISVNKAWEEYSIANGETTLARTSIGSNYFDVCKKAMVDGNALAGEALKGILTVLSKKKQDFELEYPCHSPNSKRWFSLRVRNIESDTPKVVIAHQDITTRKKAETRIQASEERYRRLFESAHDGILILTAENGKIVDVNPYLINILGYTKQEIMAKELWELGFFKDKTASQIAFLELQQFGYISYDDLPLKTKEGIEIKVEFVSNVYAENGKQVIQCNIRDVTARKNAEVVLKASEEKFHSLFENMQEGFAHCKMIYENDEAVDFIYLDVNTKFEVLTGLKNVTGKKVSKVIPELKSKDHALFEIYDNVVKTGISVKTEYFINALAMWVYITVYRTPQHNFVAVFDVIDERKNAEDALKKLNKQLIESITETEKTKDYYKSLIENSSDAIMIIDATGKMGYQSPAVERIGGFSQQDLYGKNPIEFMHPDDISNFAESMTKLISKPETIVAKQYRLCNKNGAYIWIEGTIANRLNDENIKGLISNFRDITDRKTAEAEIIALNESLERKILERTTALQHSNDELKAFTYSVSHDLRAPLRAINGFSAIILKEYSAKLNDDGKRMFTLVMDSATKMGQLIDDLLNYSRVGNTELSVSNTDISEIAHQVERELKHAHPDSNVELVIDKMPKIMCDHLMMHQALQNLLGNAFKYSASKAAPLVHFGAYEEFGETVFYVKDNGAGFDMRFSDKLFSMFQRLHAASQFEGTGIGLCIVQRIIQKHGGRIWAEGEVDKGATFYFSLPNNKNKTNDELN